MRRNQGSHQSGGQKKLIQRSIDISYDIFDSLEERHKFNHFAFIWDKNKLLAIGKNNPAKTNRKVLYFGERFNVDKFKKYPFIHAEIDALAKCWGRYEIGKSHTMVVIRIDRNGRLNNSKPCPNCSQVLQGIGLENIIWSS